MGVESQEPTIGRGDDSEARRIYFVTEQELNSGEIRLEEALPVRRASMSVTEDGRPTWISTHRGGRFAIKALYDYRGDNSEGI